LNKGGSEVILQRVLGHSSLTMISRVYTHLADQDVRKAMLEHLQKVRQE
jgi:integrase